MTISGGIQGVNVGNQDVAFTLTQITVSGNAGNGIDSLGTFTVTNSTVSGNSGNGISNEGTLTLSNATVSGNSEHGISNNGTAALANSLVDGDCVGSVTSQGYNIESPGNACGFDQPTDQVNVTEGQLNLGPLADNGGPTLTHKPGDGGLGTGSVAIDMIPVVDCVDADGAPLLTDQRGLPRPGGTMCDVGAFEVQP